MPEQLRFWFAELSPEDRREVESLPTLDPCSDLPDVSEYDTGSINSRNSYMPDYVATAFTSAYVAAMGLHFNHEECARRATMAALAVRNFEQEYYH